MNNNLDINKNIDINKDIDFISNKEQKCINCKTSTDFELADGYYCAMNVGKHAY